MKEKVLAVLSAKEVSILFAIQALLTVFLKFTQMNLETLVLAIFLTAFYFATATALFNRCRVVHGLNSLGWEGGLKVALGAGWRSLLVILVWIAMMIIAGIIVGTVAKDFATDKETIRLLMSPVTLAGSVFVALITVLVCLAFVSGKTENLTRRALTYIKNHKNVFGVVLGAFVLSSAAGTFGDSIAVSMGAFTKVLLVIQMVIYQIILPIYVFGKMVNGSPELTHRFSAAEMEVK